MVLKPGDVYVSGRHKWMQLNDNQAVCICTGTDFNWTVISYNKNNRLNCEVIFNMQDVLKILNFDKLKF
jgi:hypothetical protein